MSYPFKEGGFPVPKERRTDVAAIRNWLKHQVYLPQISDEFIHLFLHSNYYSIEKTKNTIESYFTLRAENRDAFDNWDVDKMDQAFQHYTLARLPKKNPDGYRVLLYRMNETDPAKFVFLEGMKVFLAFNDYVISEDGPIDGYIVVFDMKGCAVGHLTRCSMYLNHIKVFMQYIQEAHPVRLKGVHVINTVWFMDKVMSLIKPFLQSELLQIIHFHSTLDTLQDVVPIELLPEEYGGDVKPMLSIHDEQHKILKKEYKDWLKNLSKLKADLDKKPNKKEQDVMQGSFRSLSID